MTGALTAWLTGQRGARRLGSARLAAKLDRSGPDQRPEADVVGPVEYAPQQQVSPDRSAAEAPPCVSSRTNIERSGCPFLGTGVCNGSPWPVRGVPGRLQNRGGREVERLPWRAAGTRLSWSAILERTRRCGGSIPASRWST